MNMNHMSFRENYDSLYARLIKNDYSCCSNDAFYLIFPQSSLAFFSSKNPIYNPFFQWNFDKFSNWKREIPRNKIGKSVAIKRGIDRKNSCKHETIVARMREKSRNTRSFLLFLPPFSGVFPLFSLLCRLQVLFEIFSHLQQASYWIQEFSFQRVQHFSHTSPERL